MTTRADDAIDDVDDEISLKPYFEALKSYRRVIGAAVVGVGVLFVVSVIGILLVAPVERVGSIRFRLLFDGAAVGQYPNHTPFSVTEIVAAPVLTEVYKVNDLQRFGTYESFKDSMFVQQSNPDLDLLGFEYQALLADTKLTPVDRARIQDEFKKKREAMVDPSYSISMRRSERLKTLPRDLMEKVLMDTLNTWAKQADERKGASKYNVDVLSTDILQRDVLDREDYMVGIDILRSKTNRVIDTINEIAKLPGARTIRVGERHTTLAEVRAGLEDVVRFKLEPLLGVIRSEGVTKNARSLLLYANNQSFQLKQDRQEAADRVRTLQESLREFTAQGGLSSGDAKAGASGPAGGAGSNQAVMAQLDQSFLDRIMALSTASADSDYRRKITDRIIEESEKMTAKSREASYYEGFVRELQGTTSHAVGSPELVNLVKVRTSEAYDEITKGIEQTAAIYRELSALNLNPSTILFSVTWPFTLATHWSLTVSTVGLYFVLLMMLTLIIVPIGCLIHHAFKKIV
jgi:hypothetical protein